MKFLRASLTGLLLLLLTLGLLALAAQVVVSAIKARSERDFGTSGLQERVFAVNVIEAVDEAVTPTFVTYGRVVSRRTLDIRSRIGGAIVFLAPEFVEGGRVEAGQLLARIDPAEAEFAIQQAEARLRAAEVNVDDAEQALKFTQAEVDSALTRAQFNENAYERVVEMHKIGAVTEERMENAESLILQQRQGTEGVRKALAAAEFGVDAATHEVTQARNDLDEAHRGLSHTRVVADFAGTLSGVSVMHGRLVQANEDLGQLVDRTALEVSFRVSTREYGRLLDDNGRLSTLSITAAIGSGDDELTAAGTISRESAVVGSGQTGRLLYADLDETAVMKPGDFVTVRIQEPLLEDIVRLPATALGPDGAVLVVDSDDRLRSLPVTLLRRQDNQILVDASDDLLGYEVVVQRSALIGPGIKVRPVSQGESTELSAFAEGG